MTTELKKERIRLSGPRLAIKVSELMRSALELRKGGATQRQLARDLGVGESRISQIINGDGNLHVATIARLFAALDLNVEIVVTDGDGKPVERRRRQARRSSAQKSTTYLHNIVDQEGSLRKVFSQSSSPHRGTPVDFPMVVVDIEETALRETIAFEALTFSGKDREIVNV